MDSHTIVWLRRPPCTYGDTWYLVKNAVGVTNIVKFGMEHGVRFYPPISSVAARACSDGSDWKLVSMSPQELMVALSGPTVTL